jgi:hypothetical protein
MAYKRHSELVSDCVENRNDHVETEPVYRSETSESFPRIGLRGE